MGYLIMVFFYTPVPQAQIGICPVVQTIPYGDYTQHFTIVK